MASTFGQLTGALERFRHEASLRERLSSLGRLSTVVAHEIRNPLMIIKSARPAAQEVTGPGRGQPWPTASTRKSRGSIASSPTCSTSRVPISLEFARRPTSSRSAGTRPGPCRRRSDRGRLSLPLVRAGARRDRPRAAARRAGQRARQRRSRPCTRRAPTAHPIEIDVVGSRGPDRLAGRRRSIAARASRPTTCRGSSSRSSRPAAAVRASASPSPATIVEGLGGTIQVTSSRVSGHDGDNRDRGPAGDRGVPAAAGRW